MKKLRVCGALLSAAAMILTMPLASFAQSTKAPEQITTAGWVEVSNATPHQGEVICMKITLPTSTEMKGISGWMLPVEGVTPITEDEYEASQSAPSPVVPPSAEPSETASTSPSAEPSVSASVAPSASESVLPSAEPSESAAASPGVEPSESADASPSTEPSASAEPSVSADISPSEKPSGGGSISGSDVEPSESASAAPSEEPEAPSSSAEPTVEPSTEPSDEEGGISAEARAENNKPGTGWTGSPLNDDDTSFIVLSADKGLNVAKRYFVVDAVPGETVEFQFKGRWSDGIKDHEFTAKHTFRVTDEATTPETILTGFDSEVSTARGSNLNFRVSSTMTAIQGVRAASSTTKGTSPGELLRGLSMSNETTARVYSGRSSTPRLSAVRTGDTVRFDSKARGGFTTEATAVVRGDILGTGKLGLNQLVAMSRALSGQLSVSEPKMQAADIDGDGQVTSKDALALKKLVLGRG